MQCNARSPPQQRPVDPLVALLVLRSDTVRKFGGDYLCLLSHFFLFVSGVPMEGLHDGVWVGGF